MRALVGSLIVVGVLGVAAPGHAQSAYDYPWCSVRGGFNGAQSCYFSTYQQCMATISGIGGTCIRSPYYRGPRVRSERPHERY